MHAPHPPFVRSPYNYDMAAASQASGTTYTEPSLTQQQFADDADINTIVRRFGLTGELPIDPRPPLYGDFTDVITDYRSALEAVQLADERFMTFPAELRARFGNDPQQLLDFVSLSSNRDEAIKLGIIPKAAIAAPEASTPPVATPPPTA